MRVQLSRGTTVALTVMAGMVMIPIDITIVAVAIARLSRDLDASLPAIQWVSTSYALSLAAAIPVAAWAMSRVGARRLFLGAVAVFTVGSALVACAWSVESLVAFRVVQGAAGGLVAPAGMTLVLGAAPAEERGRAMSVFGISALVAPVMGPVLGGWLLDTWSWRAMFLINVPIGVAGYALGRRNLPVVPVGPRRRLDVRGLVLLSPGLTLVVLATAQASTSIVEPRVLLPMVTGLALLALFVWHAVGSDAALVDIRLLRLRATGGGAVVLFLFTGALVACAILLPLYWQVGRGEGATATGLFMAPGGVAAAVSMQVGGRLIDKVSAMPVILGGSLLGVAASVVMVLSLDPDSPEWGVVAAWMAVNVAAGLVMMPTTTVATRGLSPSSVPSGSTLLQITSQASSALLVVIVSVVLSIELVQRVPGLGDRGVGALAGMSSARLSEVAPGVASSFQVAFCVPVALMVIAAVAAGAAFHGQKQPAPEREGDSTPADRS